jgi:hypothetical protein
MLRQTITVSTSFKNSKRHTASQIDKIYHVVAVILYDKSFFYVVNEITWIFEMFFSGENRQENAIAGGLLDTSAGTERSVLRRFVLKLKG